MDSNEQEPSRRARLVRQAAMASWMLPIATVMAGATLPTKAIPWVGTVWAVAGSLAMLAGMVLAIVALAHIPRYGRAGLLRPGIAGLAIGVTFLGLGVVGVIVAMREQRAKPAEVATSNRVTPSSAYDATQAIVDEDYRFKLGWPGKGWKLLGREDAAKLAPVAVAAGLSFESGAMGLVAVETSEWPNTEAAARAIAAAIGEDTGVFEHFDFQDRPAIRFSRDIDQSGRPMRIDVRVFLRDGLVYRVVTSRPTGTPDDLVAPFVLAFQALDGTARARPRRFARDVKGMGFRIEDGLYSSDPLRLVVSPSSGFHVVAGHALDAIDPTGEVAIASDDTSVVVAIGVERARGVKIAAYVKALESGAAEALGAKGDPKPLRFRMAGRDLAMRRFPATAKQEDHLIGAVLRDDWAFRVEAWYAVRDREKGKAVVEKALEAVRFAGELPAAPPDRDTEGEIGDSYALRRGTYLDFTRGLVYHPPSEGYFRVRIGAAARARDASALLHFVDLETGIYGVLSASNATDKEVFHRDAIGRMLGEGASALPEGRWGDAETRTSGKSWRDAFGRDFRQEVTTTVRGGIGYQLVIWGFEGNLAAAKGRVEAARAGLAFPQGGLPDVIMDSSVYRDRRLGFQVRIPEGWTADEGPSALPRKVGMKWQWGKESVQITAAGGHDRGTDLLFLQEMIHQRIRDVAPHTSSEPGQLGARACTRLRARDADVYLLTVDGVLYNVVVDGPEQRGAAIVRSFELLEGE